MANVLVVDDERSMREFLQVLFENDGHNVVLANNVKTAQLEVNNNTFDVAFVDLKLPDGHGLDVLRHIKEKHSDTQVIVLTAFATTQNAVEAMRLGAYDYQIKPCKVDELRALTEKAAEKAHLLRENRTLNLELQTRFGLSTLVGHGTKMQELFALIERVALASANVLIEGESGTGKELVARAIHINSPRKNGPMIAVHCGAIPETLLEAELFGHVAGAFTGAVRERIGLFESAHHGTLLLDEIGELPQSMQVKLLRVLQERSIRRLGEERERPLDIRIIAATNRDLQEEVLHDRFRQDLFFRLNVVRLRIPPLRERVEDIPILAKLFVQKFALASNKAVRELDDAAMQTLMSYKYPGNVRELENFMEHAVTLARGSTITFHDLPEGPLRALVRNTESPSATLHLPASGLLLEPTLETIERQFITQALERTGGKKGKAAELLGLSLRSLRYRLERLHMLDNRSSTDAEDP